jgi:MoxR-like ATPase
MNPEQLGASCSRILDEIEKAIIGKRAVLESMLTAFLAGGHILFEDLPGLGKTAAARSLATALGLGFKRIQFTPDLLPGDITGGMVYNSREENFSLRKGPLFCSFVLADEINRASPRTQSALLEAMQERRVSIDGQTVDLPAHFTVVATQNPVEYEGTFPLPEAQLDRFMVRLSLGYPENQHEKMMLRKRRERMTAEALLTAVLEPAMVDSMRRAMETVTLADDLETYIIDLVDATRKHRSIAVGASPRGALALQDLARARAAMSGRTYVLPDDIKCFAVQALAHRLVLEPDLWTEAHAAEKLVLSILEATPVPVVSGMV